MSTCGTFSAQPVGLSAVFAPTPAASSISTATTVAPAIEISIAPLTRLAYRIATTNSPSTKISNGQPMIEPLTPSSTGGVPAGLRTKPASNSPTKVMNRPMPIEMPTRSERGTALNTAVRKPVSTSRAISTPSMTISPIACGQVICGAMVKASRAFSPSPAAMPIGNRPMTPIRMVITPATSAVAAATLVMAWSTLAPITAPRGIRVRQPADQVARRRPARCR